MNDTKINEIDTRQQLGLLTMPYAISQVGLIPGILLVFVVGGTSAFALHLLSVAASHVGRESSFFTISRLTYPKGTKFFDLAIAIKCYGVAASYLLIIGDLLPQLMHDIVDSTGMGMLYSKATWVSLVMILLVPLSFCKRMDSLKYTSFVALASVAYMVFLVTFMYASPVNRPVPSSSPVLIGSSGLDALRALPVFIFSFTCHQNVSRRFVDNWSRN